MQIIVGELYRRGLSKREVEVCMELYDLPATSVIAGRMQIAEDTVKTHLHSIFRKLSVPTRPRLFGLLEGMIHEREQSSRSFGGLPYGKI